MSTRKPTRLTEIGQGPRKTHRLYRCTCGTVKECRYADVNYGSIVSCGCWARERAALMKYLHGMHGTRTYRIWQGFLYDMGECPSDKHSIDRYPNNDGDYEPNNCRWATRAQQARNTRRTRILSFDGRTQCLQDWAVEIGIGHATLTERIDRWGVPKALSMPKKGHDRKPIKR